VTLDSIEGLNWLAVVIGAAIYFVLGAAWFAPQLLGRAWMRAIGFDMTKGPPRPVAASFVVSAAALLVAAVATAMLAQATGSTTLEQGLLLGLTVGIGYALALTAVESAFEPMRPQPWTWFAISGGYNLVGLLIAAVLVSVWR
jgi:hypothetical protein